MRSLLWLLLLIMFSFTEVAITVLATRYLGAGLTYSLFAVPTLIGLGFQWLRWKQVRGTWREFDKQIEHRAQVMKAQGKTWKNVTELPFYWEYIGDKAMFWTAVGLLLIPGPLTALFAFCLMVPAFRRQIMRLFSWPSHEISQNRGAILQDTK